MTIPRLILVCTLYIVAFICDIDYIYLVYIYILRTKYLVPGTWYMIFVSKLVTAELLSLG